MKHTIVYLLLGLAVLALTSCNTQTAPPSVIKQAIANMLSEDTK